MYPQQRKETQSYPEYMDNIVTFTWQPHTITQTTEVRPILEEGWEIEWQQGNRPHHFWCEQEIDLETANGDKGFAIGHGNVEIDGENMGEGHTHHLRNGTLLYMDHLEYNILVNVLRHDLHM